MSQVSMVIATMLLFLASLVINDSLFVGLELMPGINWVYLPAGIRLITTLLFGGYGAIGLLLVSWLVNFTFFFPNDFERAFMGGILSTAAPYLVYRVARHCYGLHASLANLNAHRLMGCVVAYALANPLFIHLWMAAQGRSGTSVAGFMAMVVGDLIGTLLVVYAFKLALWAMDRRQA